MPTIESFKSKNLLIINTLLSMSLTAFVAKTTPWPNDSTPPAVTNTVETDFNSDIVFLKTLSGSALRFMVTRKDWAVGSYIKNDFVMTEDNNVYLCTESGTSGQKPTHQNGVASDLNGTAKWEFSEHVHINDTGIFLTDSLIPLSLKCEKYLYMNLVKSVGITFDIVGNEDEFLPLTTQYRVVGLYANSNFRSSKSNTSAYKDEVKDMGYVLTWQPISPSLRTLEQIDSYTFFIDLN